MTEYIIKMAEGNRSTHMTNGQKRILTEWVKQHPQLLSGLFSNSYTKKDSQKLFIIFFHIDKFG